MLIDIILVPHCPSLYLYLGKQHLRRRFRLLHSFHSKPSGWSGSHEHLTQLLLGCFLKPRLCVDNVPSPGIQTPTISWKIWMGWRNRAQSQNSFVQFRVTLWDKDLKHNIWGKKSEFLTLTTIRTVMYKWSVTVRKCNKENNTILHTCRGKLCAGTGKKRAGLWLRRQSWKPAPSAGQCRNYQWYFPTRSHLWRL